MQTHGGVLAHTTEGGMLCKKTEMASYSHLKEWLQEQG